MMNGILSKILGIIIIDFNIFSYQLTYSFLCSLFHNIKVNPTITMDKCCSNGQVISLTKIHVYGMANRSINWKA